MVCGSIVVFLHLRQLGCLAIIAAVLDVLLVFAIWRCLVLLRGIFFSTVASCGIFLALLHVRWVGCFAVVAAVLDVLLKRPHL